MKGLMGSWALEVIANGRDLNLDPSKLAHMYVISNINQALPSLSIGFKDDTGKELDNLLGDGAPITVSIGNPAHHVYNGLQFQASGTPKVNPNGTANMITFSGVLNKTKWLRKVVDKHYEGTASSVIAQLASEAGLIPDVDSSMDAMTWLPNRTSLANYANHVLQRSFSGEASALIMAVTDSGKLRLKDLNGLIGGGGITLASNPTQGHPVLNYVAVPRANSNNSSHGYGSTTIGMNPDGSIFEGNEVAVKLMSAATSIGSTIKEAVGSLGTRINALAPLAGNTHEKWYEAIHQNMRIKSTYSFDIELITDVPSKLELLDTPMFKPVNSATGQEATALSGKYIVTCINKFIQNNRYWEKICLTSQGAGGI